MNMKKSIAALSLALVSAIGFTAVAQDINTKKPEDQKKERKDKQKRDDKRNVPNPFEGITLTADQQSKIDALNKEMREERQAKAKENKENKMADRKDAGAKMKQQKQEYLAKLKNILTPDQYISFLENAYTTPAPQMQGQRGGMMRGDMPQRGGMHGNPQGGFNGGRR